MGADLSRVRFDPRRDHAGVVLQQGRLLLDADWNELVAIIDRRLRANVADLDSGGPAPGIAGVAVVPRTTPDAFKVTLSGGALTIGRGRMYVDGILAENHGLDPAVFEPLLSELQGSADTPYATQPYWPVPDPLPVAGSHLAYLDVWDREVTHIEAPDLIEQAVGVDTTARRQIAWQVRLHPLDNAAVTCTTPDADIPGWVALTAPSGGRLTVETIEVEDDEDPCELPPTGGYRGLENQTYRVEVHAGGALGTATFKWSRDDGSVVSAVLEVLPGGAAIRPASFGRDAVLGFADGDWVEVTDDHRELDGSPGEVRRIEVHEEDGTFALSAALPADLQMPVDQAASRHLRVRRWDQKGQVRSSAGSVLVDLDAPTATGLITVPASAGTSVVLERGIVVRFSSAGGPLRTGDHWVFAARTADTSVETLVAAPPLGTHHHYARLGVVTFPDGETDCRQPWPPACDCGEGGCGDCTVCVTPQSHASGSLTIQAAVNQVKELGGGTVCLDPGVYHLDDAGIVVDRATSLRIRGGGVRSVIVAPGSGIIVTNSAFVTVEDLAVLSSGGRSAVELRATAAVTVQRVVTLALGTRDLPAPAIGLGGICLRTSLRDNVVVAQWGIGGGDAEAALLTAALDVRDNVLLCRDVGIGFAGRVAHLLGNHLVGNTVLRAAQAGIRLLGAVAPGHGCTVADNTVGVGGTGVQVATSGYTVQGNDITGTPQARELLGDGIAVLPSTFGTSRGPTRIASNRVRDIGGRGVAILAPITSLEVVDNLVERAFDGIVMDERARAISATVSGNTVTDVGARETDKGDGVAGIRVVGAERASVESNTVRGVGAAVSVRGTSIAIEVLACVESRVAGNAVDRVGLPTDGGSDLGIAVRGLVARAQVSGNSARRQPADVDADAPSAFQGLLVGSDMDQREVGVTLVKGYAVGKGIATFAIGRMTAFATPFPDAGMVAFVPPIRPSTVTVDGNIIAGSRAVPVALVGTAGVVVVNGNQFHQAQETDAPALRLVALAATVNANHFRGGKPSAQLDVDPERLAVLGNLTSNGIVVSGGGLDPRWDPLNLNNV